MVMKRIGIPGYFEVENGHPLLVTGIHWSALTRLPEAAEVVLDADLVSSLSHDDGGMEKLKAEWRQTIIEELTKAFGVCPIEIGGWQPAQPTRCTYIVAIIEWPRPGRHLPEEAQVTLSMDIDDINRADYPSERAFLVAREEIFLAALKDKFGFYPERICGFERIEESN